MHRIIWLLPLLGALALNPAAAQTPEPGTVEVSGFVGGISGIGTHPVIGTSAAFTLNRYVKPFAEFSYAPLGNDAYSPVAGTVATQSSNLYHFNAGFQLSHPTTGRIVPYATFGLGFVRSTSEQLLPQPVGFSRLDIEDTDLAFNIGGGVRFYVTENWGIRPEVQAVATGNSYGRYAVGLFYQFR
jgi:opacity protein-like surface antigen